METFLEILKYLLPALVVLATAYIILRYYTDLNYKIRTTELKKDGQRITINLRLQAYERLILLMERIHPGQLVVRSHQTGQSTLDLKNILILTLKEEFDHNLSQQLYVSDQVWSLVISTREIMIRLINESAFHLKEDPSATGLAKQVIEGYMQLDNDPIQLAINKLKKEAILLF